MSADKRSAGQVVVERVAEYFAGYLYLTDPAVGLVLALWAIGSWTFDKFYTWPYLGVTAAVKGAGKTRVLELLLPLVRNGLLSASPTPAFVLREARNASGHFTLLWDEAEAASSDAKSFLSEVLNSGYRRGQWIGRAKGPEETIKYPSYFPKAFALIGDTTGTVRDRSIVLTMDRGNARREFIPEIAEGEAAELLGEVRGVLGSGDSAVQSAPVDWLDTRDREIWGSIFGLAEWLKLDKVTMERLYRFAADNVASKTAPKRRNTSYEDENSVIDERYGERALKDLMSVYRDGEVHISSAEAVKRMRELPTGPWRLFKGEGLNEITLANLVNRFGVQTTQKRPVSGKGSSKVNPVRGYSRASVVASGGKL